VAQEKERNARLGGRSCEQLVTLMSNIKLELPNKINLAVHANRSRGNCSESLSEALQEIGGGSPQGRVLTGLHMSVAAQICSVHSRNVSWTMGHPPEWPGDPP